MHPVERLRHVANARGYDPVSVARESAYALAQISEEDPPGLVPACRRLIDRHLTSGPLWWLSARMLVDADPVGTALAAADELDGDPTDRALERIIPDDIAALVIGWPDLAGAALRRRGDIEALVVECDGEGQGLVRRLRDAGNEFSLIPDLGVASAAVVADLVLVEAHAAGPTGVLANRGSHAAAAVAARTGVPVWAVAGVGRVLPGELWGAMLARVDDAGDEPWDRRLEVVPAGLITSVVGPDGLGAGAAPLGEGTCPVAAELLRPAG